jgi:hypothetical protein
MHAVMIRTSLICIPGRRTWQVFTAVVWFTAPLDDAVRRIRLARIPTHYLPCVLGVQADTIIVMKRLTMM